MRERWGLDTATASSRDVFEALYMLLRGRVTSELGMLRQTAPPRPEFCTYAGHKDPTSEYSKALSEWQAGLCGLDRWTSVEQLDRHLTEAL